MFNKYTNIIGYLVTLGETPSVTAVTVVTKKEKRKVEFVIETGESVTRLIDQKKAKNILQKRGFYGKPIFEWTSENEGKLMELAESFIEEKKSALRKWREKV